MDKLQLRFSTHNINGFNRHKPFLRSRCENEPNTILCMQEHWLRPPFKRTKGVNEFRHLHENFDGYATSGMKEAIKNKILTGRPFGGTGYMWNKKYSKSIKPRIDYKHERVTVLEVTGSEHNILCINAYMPYFNQSNLNEQLALYHDTIGYIDHIIDDNPGYKLILLGDFNCNIYKNDHPFTPAIRNLMTRRRLFCTYDLIDNLNPDVLYTRQDFKTGSSSLLDYVFVSEELRDVSSNILISHFPDKKVTIYLCLLISNYVLMSLITVV